MHPLIWLSAVIALGVLLYPTTPIHAQDERVILKSPSNVTTDNTPATTDCFKEYLCRCDQIDARLRAAIDEVLKHRSLYDYGWNQHGEQPSELLLRLLRKDARKAQSDAFDAFMQCSKNHFDSEMESLRQKRREQEQDHFGIQGIPPINGAERKSVSQPNNSNKTSPKSPSVSNADIDTLIARLAGEKAQQWLNSFELVTIDGRFYDSRTGPELPIRVDSDLPWAVGQNYPRIIEHGAQAYKAHLQRIHELEGQIETLRRQVNSTPTQVSVKNSSPALPVKSSPEVQGFSESRKRALVKAGQLNAVQSSPNSVSTYLDHAAEGMGKIDSSTSLAEQLLRSRLQTDVRLNPGIAMGEAKDALDHLRILEGLQTTAQRMVNRIGEQAVDIIRHDPNEKHSIPNDTRYSGGSVADFPMSRRFNSLSFSTTQPASDECQRRLDILDSVMSQ